MYKKTAKNDKNILKSAEEANINDLINETKLSSWLENNLDMDMEDCKELLPQILKDICASEKQPNYVEEYNCSYKDNSYSFTIDIDKFVEALENDYNVDVSQELLDKVSDNSYKLEMEISLTRSNRYLSSVELELSGGKRTRSISAKFDKINNAITFRKRGETFKEDVMISYFNHLYYYDVINMPMTNRTLISIKNDIDSQKIPVGKDVSVTIDVPNSDPKEDDYETETEYFLARFLYLYCDNENIPKGKVTFKAEYYNNYKKEITKYKDVNLSPTDYIEKEDDIILRFVAVEWSE